MIFIQPMPTQKKVQNSVEFGYNNTHLFYHGKDLIQPHMYDIYDDNSKSTNSYFGTLKTCNNAL